MPPRKCLSMEFSFVALIGIMGFVLFMLAASMSHSYHGNLINRYALASRAFLNYYNNPSSNSTAGVTVTRDTAEHIARLLAMSTTVPPVTDPPWMKETQPQPLSPFKPSGPHPFLRPYVIQSPDICRNASVDVLIIIHSAVTHFQSRRILRETWAGTDTIQGLSVRRVFALGRNSSDKLSQVLVNTEQANYGDIVQGDFTDTFGNLTHKAVNMLRWINDHCLHARFVLKTDDDIFMNVFHLAENYLQRLAGQRRAVMCTAKPDNSSIIVRDTQSKWRVPESLLPGRTHWPAFCSGFVVVLTMDNVPELYRASFTAPFVPVDDAYVYGVLPLALKDYSLRYVDISEDLVVPDGKLVSLYQDSRGRGGAAASPPLPPKLAGTVSSVASFLKLWQLVLEDWLSLWGRARVQFLHQRVNVSAMHL